MKSAQKAFNAAKRQRNVAIGFAAAAPAAVLAYKHFKKKEAAYFPMTTARGLKKALPSLQEAAKMQGTKGQSSALAKAREIMLKNNKSNEAEFGKLHKMINLKNN